jgi:hypothetical protein
VSKLLEKMARKPIMHRCLETLLDLTHLEKGEFFTYLRSCSLLEAKIRDRIASRSPEETLKALLQHSTRGLCRGCWEVLRNCTCFPNLP